MDASEGFPPVARASARILVLGSLPGARSLAEQEYYAHPQNVFWPLMNEIFGIRGNYADRCRGLMDNRVALWDVLQASVRPGSLDADIRVDTAVANDFGAFLAKYPGIERIAFNGKKAEALFMRMVPHDLHAHLKLVGLPSTSPAYAAMSYSGKLSAWRTGLQTNQTAR